MNARDNARQFIPSLNRTLRLVGPSAQAWLAPGLKYQKFPMLLVIMGDRQVPVVLFIDGSTPTPLSPDLLADRLAVRFRMQPIR